MTSSDVTVRPAVVADEAALLALHTAQNDFGGRWYENPFSGGHEVRWDDLTPSKRWLHGGPWMDPQLLSLHVQRFAANGGSVIVAERGGQVVGSAELWRAEEPLPMGAYLDIETLVADPGGDAEIEGALVEAAMREARARDLRSLDVAPLHAGGDATRLAAAGFLMMRDHRTVHVAADHRPPPPEYGVRSTAPAYADLRDMIALNHTEPAEYGVGNLGNEWAGGLLREWSRPFGALLRVAFADIGIMGRVCLWLSDPEAEIGLWVPTMALGNVSWFTRAAAAALDFVAKHHRAARYRTTVVSHLVAPLRDLGFEDGAEPDPWMRNHVSPRNL